MNAKLMEEISKFSYAKARAFTTVFSICWEDVLSGSTFSVGRTKKLLKQELLGHGRQQDVVYVFCFVLDCFVDEN